jgi:hypothetical protein
MLGEWIKDQVFKSEREASDRRFTLLCKLPANTFKAIYGEWEACEWNGALYNGVYFSDWEIYAASLARGEGYEQLL